MYFSPETDTKLNFDQVDKDSLAMLEQARGLAKVPFYVTSSYRTPEQSVAVGGLNNDAHQEEPCTAFDIAYLTHDDRARIIYGCVVAGFRRIGVNEKNMHVHVDNSKKLINPAFWIE